MNDVLQKLITIQSGAKELPEESLNKKIKIKLYSHQLETIQRMIDIESGINNKDTFHCGFGILADPVGSGKTLEILSLIAASPKVNPLNSKKIIGSNKRIVVSDRIIYEIDIPYTHETEFVFNKTTLQNNVYGNNNFLNSISYSYYNTNVKNPTLWEFEVVNTNIIIVPHNVISSLMSIYLSCDASCHAKIHSHSESTRRCSATFSVASLQVCQIQDENKLKQQC